MVKREIKNRVNEIHKIISQSVNRSKVGSLISQRHSSTASEIWLHRTLLSHFSNLLTTPRLQTVGRPTERCLKTWVHLKPNLLYWWSNLLYWWSSVQIMYRSITFARRSSGIMNLAGQCSLSCVSVIDHFELVLRFFWTFLTSENPHSRKHPLYLHHTPRKPSQSAETRLYLISLSISLKIPR